MTEVDEMKSGNMQTERIFRMLSSASRVPEFGKKSIPVTVAAKVMGREATWIQAGLISGWLPFGIATQDKKKITSLEQVNRRKRMNYYISPKLFWEFTGYVWKGSDEDE